MLPSSVLTVLLASNSSSRSPLEKDAGALGTFVSGSRLQCQHAVCLLPVTPLERFGVSYKVRCWKDRMSLLLRQSA